MTITGYVEALADGLLGVTLVDGPPPRDALLTSAR
jgi:hypothetical protein